MTLTHCIGVGRASTLLEMDPERRENKDSIPMNGSHISVIDRRCLRLSLLQRHVHSRLSDIAHCAVCGPVNVYAQKSTFATSLRKGGVVQSRCQIKRQTRMDVCFNCHRAGRASAQTQLCPKPLESYTVRRCKHHRQCSP